jgi:hypothetical protein
MAWAVLAATGAIALNNLPPVAAGEGTAEVRHIRGCTDATLRGAYGIQMVGTRVSPFGGGIESVIGVVMRSYDGQGNFSQIDTVKGSISATVPGGTPVDREGTGTYEVREDCTGITRFQPDAGNPNLVIEERLVIVDGGREVRTMTLTPVPLMLTTVQLRVRDR